MKSPKVTIVVPSRERADTLQKTLETCTMQDYENLEILVSDNLSRDHTEAVVRAAIAQDERVRYVKTPQRVGMSGNWEFALSHVEDGFVLVLGDDDGMLPHAVRDVVRILEESDCLAIGWDQAFYTWPSCGGTKPPNELKLSLKRNAEVCSSRQVLERVLAYEHTFKRLPGLYWGAVHRDVLRRATSASGRFFHSMNPDIYSCFASTLASERFVYVDGPFSVAGLSHHSTGVSFMAGESAEGSRISTFFKEGEISAHPQLAMVPSPVIYLTEGYLQARDHVPGGHAFPEVRLPLMFEAAMREMSDARSESAYELVKGAVLKMGEQHGLGAQAAAAIAHHPYRGSQESPVGLNLLKARIKIDCVEMGVSDVREAATLCYNTLKLFERGYFSPAGMAKSALTRVVQNIERRVGG